MRTLREFLFPAAASANPGDEITIHPLRGGFEVRYLGRGLLLGHVGTPSQLDPIISADGWYEMPAMVYQTRRKSLYLSSTSIEGPGNLEDEARARIGRAIAMALKYASEQGAQSAWAPIYSDTLSENELTAFWNGAGFFLRGFDRDHRPIYSRPL